MSSRVLFLVGAVLLLARDATAFSMASSSTNNGIHTALDATNSRRAFMGSTSAFVTFTMLTLPVCADEGSVDDLSMPTEGDKKDEDAAMAERLRKKAELKKKMARPTTYIDSLKGEQEKKRDLQKSQEERRNALCEELGRGC